MKKLTVVLSLLFLAATIALPAGAQAAPNSKICKNIRGDLQRTAKALARTQSELNSAKIRLVSERQYARELTNKYHQAVRKAKRAVEAARDPLSQMSFLISKEEGRKIKRTERAAKAARRASLRQGRVVKSFERETKKLGVQIKALNRAYKATQRSLKRNNC